MNAFCWGGCVSLWVCEGQILHEAEKRYWNLKRTLSLTRFAKFSLIKTTLCCSIYLMLWQSTHFDITWWCRNRSTKSMNHLIGRCVTSSRQLLKKKRHRTGKDYHIVCWFTSASIRRYLGLDQSTGRASSERWSRWLITSTLVERRTTTNRRLSDVPNLVI